MKLSIKEYSEFKSISPQAVYQATNKGTLDHVVENGKKYVMVDDREVKEVNQSVEQTDKQVLINDLLNQLKDKDKQIQKLTKKLLKCSSSKEEVLLKYIAELKNLETKNQLPTPKAVAADPEPEAEEAELEEAKPTKKKKKKKK